MSGRLVSLFRRFVREFETPSVKTAARRSLVPDRFSGPKSIAVHYRVEDTSKVYSVRHQLQAPYRFFTRCLLKTTMTSDNEATALITPPAAVRGMKTLDRSLFRRTVSIPALKVPSRHIRDLTKTLRVALLKMMRVKPVAELAKDDPLHHSHKLFLLNPSKFRTVEDFSVEERKKLAEFGVSLEEELLHFDLEVGYENWGVPEVLRAVLPERSEGVSGYSIIGHIAHLNLKPEVLDFKHLIGEVIVDKNSSVKTVVNKLNTIDNTFRNFQMELLAGEDNFITRAKENGCVFEMDFSKVYWNPRLSTEHERVVSVVKAGAVLYDVFAGVGPFAIPAARRGVSVLANDLNPHSHSALCANVKLNKVKAGTLQAYNMDGREFILTVVKPDLTARLQARAGVCGVGEEHADAATAPTQANAIPETVGSTTNPAIQDTKTESCSAEKATSTQADSNSSKIISTTARQQEPPECHKGHDSSVSSDYGAGSVQELYVTMNLPALALQFLDAFCGLLGDFPAHLRTDPRVVCALPTVICYCFEHKNEVAEGDVKSRAEKIMGHRLPADATVRTVRNVAPGKEMLCLQFRLTPDIVFGVKSKSRDPAVCPDSRQAEEDQPPSKRQKMSESV